MSVAPKNITRPAPLDLSKQNPLLNGVLNQGGTVGSNVFRGPKDHVIGYQVTIFRGVYKGYIGIIKDTNGSMVRVELSSKNRIITIERDKLKRRL
jgi:transcription elongation factor SPT5